MRFRSAVVREAAARGATTIVAAATLAAAAAEMREAAQEEAGAVAEDGVAAVVPPAPTLDHSLVGCDRRGSPLRRELSTGSSTPWMSRPPSPSLRSAARPALTSARAFSATFCLSGAGRSWSLDLAQAEFRPTVDVIAIRLCKL